MLKRLLFFVLAALFFGMRANGAAGEVELPVVQAAEQEDQQPLMPPSADTADADNDAQASPPAARDVDATTNPQQAL